jgi:glutathione S-transferase
LKNMLTIYNFGPIANSLKPLLSLYEKGLEFRSRPLNMAEFEHYEDWFKRINPSGLVPALEHDGKMIGESTVICEYLEDAFPDAPPLRPRDAYGTAQMRLWTKWVDEYFMNCVSTVGWHMIVGKMIAGYTDEEFEAKVANIPTHEQKLKWRRARKGFPQELVDDETRKIAYSVKKLDARLAESAWLAGPEYSLADICNFSIANGMQYAFSQWVNARDTPHLIDWIGRINDRPAAKAMFAANSNPFAVPI